MNLLHLRDYSIQDQLLLEEKLLRHDDRNFCILNCGTPPAIVMGISGKAESLVHLDQLPSSIPLLRRFSGGGTVIVDENTVFVTFICNKAEYPFPAYPEPILRWAESMLAPAIEGLKLRENDFVLGERKCGGNALYIRRERWLVHTSLLWDYDPSRMSLLKHPPKTPAYRAGRPHEDFVCKLADHFKDRDEWMASLKKHFLSQMQEMEFTGTTAGLPCSESSLSPS
jgi:lipoate---protein ligase